MAGRALVDERHRVHQRAIATVTAGRLRALLLTLPDLEQEQIDRYVAEAYPTVAGGQRLAADTAAGYAELLAQPLRGKHPRPRRPVDVERALERAGVLVQPDSRSLVAPTLRARKLVGDGELQATALRAAAAYAADLSSGDLQAAMRVGVDEGAHASGLEVHGWHKAPVGSACEWCQSIAENTYGSPDAIPFHDGDRCGVEPDLADEQAPYVYTEADIPF